LAEVDSRRASAAKVVTLTETDKGEKQNISDLPKAEGQRGSQNNRFS